MTAVAIIPARGGSKGVPRKNLAEVGGLPLLVRTIHAARTVPSLARVIVSTDDDGIAAIARHAGADVVLRPPELATDDAPSELALLHVLDELRHREGMTPDVTVFLQCTSPFTTGADIEAVLETLVEEAADSVFTAQPFTHFLWRRDATGRMTGVNHDATMRVMRQHREEEYLENGAIYAMRTEGFLRSRHRFFGAVAVHVMPPGRSLEIDTQEDLSEARRMAGGMDERLGRLPRHVAALVMDFDGVFTDNTVLVLQDGREAVRCSRADGLGIELLHARGLRMAVISSETNPVVQARCDKLGLPCIRGAHDKRRTLAEWASESGVDLRDIVYLGNDVNDLPCLRMAGCGVVVADAHPDAMAAAALVLTSPGGQGAIRELADMLLHRMEREEGGLHG